MRDMGSDTSGSDPVSIDPVSMNVLIFGATGMVGQGVVRE
jgi:hypothetical protein